MIQTVSPGSAVDRVRLARVANGVSWIRMSGVARSSGSATVVLVAGKALSLIIVLGLAKTVPPADYGVFVFARNLVLILGPIATLGWGVAAVGFLPSYMATRRSELAKGFHLAAMGTTIATALVLTVALTAALALFPNLLEATFRPTVTIALTGLVGYALMTLNSETARALGLFSVAYVPSHLGHPLLLMGLLGALWIGSVPIDRVNAILVLVLSYSTVAALQLALILSSAPLSFRQAKPAWSVREWFWASAPLTLITASILIVELSPPVILGFFAPASTVGVFGLIVVLVQSLSILNWALFGVVAPHLTAAIAMNRQPDAERMLRVVRLLAGIAGLTASAVLVLTAATVGPLALPHLVPPLDTLGIAIFGYLCTAFAGPVGTVLIALGRRRELVVSNLASAAVTLGTAVVLIPTFKLDGAALAGSIGCLTRSFLLGFIVHRRHRFGW